MSVHVWLVLIDLAAVVILVARRLDVRLVLLVGALPLFLARAGVAEMLDKLVREMSNPATIVPIGSAMGFAYVLKTTGFQTISNDFASMNATLNHGRPLRIEAPRSPALADIHALAGVLFPEIGPPAARSGSRPFFAQLSRHLGKNAVPR